MNLFRLTKLDLAELNRNFDRVAQALTASQDEIARLKKAVAIGGGGGPISVAPVPVPPPAPYDQDYQNMQRQGWKPGGASNCMWGLTGDWTGFGVSGGGTRPVNKLRAIPHFFGRAGTIERVAFKSNGAGSSNVSIAIYDNDPTLAYPGALLASTKFEPMPNGTSIWDPVLEVAAGTLLWMVYGTNSGGSTNMSDIGNLSMMGPQIIGVPDQTFQDPTLAWEVTRTYDGNSPDPFPGSPTVVSGTSANLWAFLFQYSGS